MQQKRKSKALIIFIKNPLSGKVKTRIASQTSDDYALKVYKALLDHTRSVTESLEVTRYLYYSEHIPESDDWDPLRYVKRTQSEGGLGIKMMEALKDALSDHEQVLIIGSDCIQINAHDIRAAFNKLDDYDTVLGPAIDGGYYLFGTKTCNPVFLHDIPWSTEVVADKTLEAIISSGYSCHFTRPLSDIDYLEDWEKYGYKI